MGKPLNLKLFHLESKCFDVLAIPSGYFIFLFWHNMLNKYLFLAKIDVNIRGHFRGIILPAKKSLEKGGVCMQANLTIPNLTGLPG